MPNTKQEKDLVYTHRVHYKFTKLNGPERDGIEAYQNFTCLEWAQDFYQYAKDSKFYIKVELKEIDNE